MKSNFSDEGIDISFIDLIISLSSIVIVNDKEYINETSLKSFNCNSIIMNILRQKISIIERNNYAVD